MGASRFVEQGIRTPKSARARARVLETIRFAFGRADFRKTPVPTHTSSSRPRRTHRRTH